MTIEHWRSEVEPTWCPGCGNFKVLEALVQALVALKLEPRQICLVSGIGQAGKMPQYLNCNFLHGLHGRVLAKALGVKLANPGLQVIAVGGDGDMYSAGGGHLVHAFRRNPDIACLVCNNGIYGLTKGQAGPTSELGFVSRTSPAGTIQPSFNPLAVGIAAGGTFLARGFAGDTEQLSRLLVQAVEHKGFGFVDVLQPCVTYNRVNTYQWYEERVHDLAQAGHDPRNREQAFVAALEWPGSGKRIPTGLFYQEQRTTYEEQMPALRRGALVERAPRDELLARALEAHR